MTDLLWQHLLELPYFRGTLRAVEGRLMRVIDLPRPMLDLGCGDGHFGSVAFEMAIEVGVDPAIRLLHEAKRRNAYYHLTNAEGAHLPYPQAYFASVFSNSVLEHIPVVEPVLRELARVLQPGGTLVFTVPNPSYLSELSLFRMARGLGCRRLGELYARWFRRATRVHHLDWEDTWGERLGVAGFDLLKAIRYFSPGAMRMLEWGHYLGVPSLVSHWLTKRWVLLPSKFNLWLTERQVRRYYDEHLRADGAFTLYHSRRR